MHQSSINVKVPIIGDNDLMAEPYSRRVSLAIYFIDQFQVMNVDFQNLLKLLFYLEFISKWHTMCSLID